MTVSIGTCGFVLRFTMSYLKRESINDTSPCSSACNELAVTGKHLNYGLNSKAWLTSLRRLDRACITQQLLQWVEQQ
jgi:hypothetical protein